MRKTTYLRNRTYSENGMVFGILDMTVILRQEDVCLLKEGAPDLLQVDDSVA